jgi:putative lipoprotein
MIFQPRAALTLAALVVVVTTGCGRLETPQESAIDEPTSVTIPAREAVAEATPSPTPTEAPPAVRTITGEVFYRERIRLPSDAAMTVTLLQRGDSGDSVIVRSTFTPRPQVPIPFELEYRTADISAGASYGLDVEITRRGEVIFALSDPAPVITKGAPQSGLKLLLRRRS